MTSGSFGNSMGRLRTYDALVLTAGLWFLAKFLRYAFPPLFAPLQDAYGVTNAGIGAAYTVLMATYAAMQFPSGALSDRVGPVKVIAAGAIIAAVAATTIILPASFAVLVAGMALIGIGTGVHKTVAVAMLSTIYARQPGRALGVLDTVGAFGGVVAPPAAVVLLDTVGWRFLFLVGGLSGFVLTVLFLRHVPSRMAAKRDAGDTSTGESDGNETSTGGPGENDERETTDSADGDAALTERVTGRVRTYATLFTDRTLATVVVAAVLVSFAYNGAVAFLPLYLIEEANVTAAFAGVVYSAFFFVSLVQLLTGEVSDTLGELPVLTGTLALGAVGLVALLFVAGPVAIAAAVVVFGIGVHGHRPVRAAYFMTLLPKAVEGGSLGVIRTATIGAGAAAPVIVGVISDAATFQVAFGVLAVTFVVAVGLVVAVLVGASVRRRVWAADV